MASEHTPWVTARLCDSYCAPYRRPWAGSVAWVAIDDLCNRIAEKPSRSCDSRARTAMPVIRPRSRSRCALSIPRWRSGGPGDSGEVI
jgi:hypothetical protein